MKKILIIGADTTSFAVTQILENLGAKAEDVIIVTPENIEEHKNEIGRQNPFGPEPIILHNLAPKYENTPVKIDTSNLGKYHPFAKFIGKKKRK